jgi:hypothetical protein
MTDSVLRRQSRAQMLREGTQGSLGEGRAVMRDRIASGTATGYSSMFSYSIMQVVRARD